MADVQHSGLTDPNVHEPKGITGALANQVYVADGNDSGDWTAVDYPVADQTVIIARDTADQNPTAVDTALQVTFGPEQTGGEVEVSSTGDITFVQGGSYLVSAVLRIGRDSGTGIASVGIRFLVNGVEGQRPTCIRLTDSGYTIPFTITLSQSFSAGDVLTVEIIRDSSGANNGGLKTFSFVEAGWGDASSAVLRVTKQSAGL